MQNDGQGIAFNPMPHHIIAFSQLGLFSARVTSIMLYRSSSGGVPCTLTSCFIRTCTGSISANCHIRILQTKSAQARVSAFRGEIHCLYSQLETRHVLMSTHECVRKLYSRAVRPLGSLLRTSVPLRYVSKPSVQTARIEKACSSIHLETEAFRFYASTIHLMGEKYPA